MKLDFVEIKKLAQQTTDESSLQDSVIVAGAMTRLMVKVWNECQKSDADVTDLVSKMQLDVDDTNTELAHMDADTLLCEFVRKLGYVELADKYTEVHKWYS